MGGTPTLNDSLPPKHRQFSLEDVEDHYLEWLEKWIAEIESGPARHMPRPIQVDTREPGLENRQRRKSLVGSNPIPSASESSVSGFSSSLREKRALGRNPTLQVHRRTALVEVRIINRYRAGSLRGRGKLFGLKAGLELRICNTPGVGANPTQD